MNNGPETACLDAFAAIVGAIASSGDRTGYQILARHMEAAAVELIALRGGRYYPAAYEGESNYASN